MKRWSIPAVALVAAGLLVASSTVTAREAGEGKSADKAKVGQPAPTFTLMDQNGKPVSLADHADKVVVLEWFNDGCPFVVKHYQNGDMNALANRYKDKGVVWLAVNSTSSADQQHNKEIAGKWSVDRPILDDSDGKVGRMYDAKTTPHMYVVNKGTLVYAGAIDSDNSPDANAVKGAENYVARALDEILAGQSVSRPETKSYGCSVKYARK